MIQVQALIITHDFLDAYALHELKFYVTLMGCASKVRKKARRRRDPDSAGPLRFGAKQPRKSLPSHLAIEESQASPLRQDGDIVDCGFHSIRVLHRLMSSFLVLTTIPPKVLSTS